MSQDKAKKKSVLKWVLLGIFLGIPGVIWGAAYWISPPGGGRDLVAKAGLPYPTLVAHRGASFLAPEETRPAYLLARSLGADYLELDVQRSKDGVLVAFHDKDLTRTTNAAELFPGRQKQGIGQFTYAELQRLDVGSWFNKKYPKRARKKYKGLKILTLEQVLSLAEGGKHKPGLYIETKVPERYPGIEKQLVQLLTKRGWLAKGYPVQKAAAAKKNSPLVRVGLGANRLLFQSFSAKSLGRLRAQAPGVPVVYLLSSKMVKASGWQPLLDKALNLGAVGIGPVGYKAFFWHTGPAHEKKLIVHPYTLNTAWQMRLVLQFGADGFFTDRTYLALKMLDRPYRAKDLEALFQKLGYAAKP